MQLSNIRGKGLIRFEKGLKVNATLFEIESVFFLTEIATNLNKNSNIS